MKAVIKFEMTGQGMIEVDYDPKDPPNIWLEIRWPEAAGERQRDRLPARVYRLIVGEKGGLTLK